MVHFDHTVIKSFFEGRSEEMKRSNYGKRCIRLAAVVAPVILAGGMLGGCGSQKAPSAQEYVSAGSDQTMSSAPSSAGSSASSAAASASVSGSRADDFADAETLLGGRQIQEDNNDIYISAINCIQRYDKSDLTACTRMYQTEGDKNKITGYCISNGNLYVLVSEATGMTDSQKQLILVTADGKSTVLKKAAADYGQVEIYQNVLYLTDTSGKVAEAYDLAADGTLGKENTDLKKTMDKLSDKVFPVSISNDYSSIYCDAAYCMAVYQKIYLTDQNLGQLLVADPKDAASLAKPKVLAKSIPGAIYGMTQNYLISIDASTYGEWKCYTTDLTTGEQKNFVTLNGVGDGTNQVLGYDEKGIYVSLSGASADKDESVVYDTAHYNFADGSKTELYTITSQPSTDITYGVYAENGVGVLQSGICYIRSQDYTDQAYMRSFDDPGSEIAFGGDPFFDSGLKKAGISLSQKEYTKYADDNVSGQEIIHVKISTPVFNGTSEAEKTMNDFFSKEIETSEKQAVKTAQEGYASCKADASSADSTGEADEYTYGFPYQYMNLVTGLTYADDRYLCLSENTYEYTGGAHGNGIDSYYVMDRQTGKQLSLGDVVDLDKTDFKSLVVKALQEKMKEDPDTYFEGADQTVKDDYKKNEFNFYLTKDGVGVEFSEYEVAPYAAGAQNVVIPYSDLKMKISVS